MVYVCDRDERPHPGLQEGRHVREGEVDRADDARRGSVWDIAFSRDPQQKYLYVADGTNMKVYILDRETLEELTALRRRRPPARPVLRRGQRRHRLEGQRLHGRDVRGQARPEVQLQGRRRRDRSQSGRALADTRERSK